MDRNEVVLVGRLPEAVHIRSLQSGSTLGTWRLIVRRQHRGRGGRVDTIPCMSFEPEVTVAAADWLPDDMVEVVGSLRRRWWGSEGSKASGYEVEVSSGRRLERQAAAVLNGDEDGLVPQPAPPRPVRSLLRARGAMAGEEEAPQLAGPAPAHPTGDGGPTPVPRRLEASSPG
ncbi:single-stranded DNA-binding protein [Streptosporangium lutulentum]|uniref:Single-stranded DNA-binding protein n=1 Tax=Streptosporangium lutulentum TaxID=1461250 RepID=A0ABT9QD80_9ACTN|nr:single-stranded DNA-binding protein [Streptosporangium lutulentum]MDP9844727.1 single-stranded DNA-binding protein [Streptosporangium lutulentum]